MKKGWEIKSLNDVCRDIFAGGDVPKNNFSKIRTDKYNIPIFANGAINKGLYGYTDQARVVDPSITVSARGTIGYSEIRREPYLPVVRLIVLIPNPEVITLPFLKYVVSTINFKNSGTSIPQLTVPMIKKNKFYIPSLSEQKRIVSILDKAFEAISKAKENAEKNLKNARELFESYLQNVFASPGDDWEEKQLEDICENLDSKRIPVTKRDRKKGKYPYYGASGIVDYVNEYIFDEDLLLVSEDGANLLARTYPIAFSITGKTWVNNHAHVLRFENIVSQKFVELYLNSIKLDNYVSGMAQPKLNQKMLNSITIPFPELKIQKQIVTNLSRLSDEAKKLGNIYQQKQADLEELKKSILQKAFNGEL